MAALFVLVLHIYKVHGDDTMMRHTRVSRGRSIAKSPGGTIESSCKEHVTTLGNETLRYRIWREEGLAG